MYNFLYNLQFIPIHYNINVKNIKFFCANLYKFMLLLNCRNEGVIMNFTITIAREYGSGGRFIAAKVAEKLGIAFYDKSLLMDEAINIGINPIDMEKLDDEQSAFYLPTMNNSVALDLELSQKSYMASLKTIQMIAATKSSVIVGRCADYILSDDLESVLRVFVYAPMESKVKRGSKFYGLPKNKDQAKDIILRHDQRRKKYYNFITDKEWGNPQSYDVMINSDMGIEAAVDAIVAAAKTKFNIK